ncbi:ferredoxin reductase family protein [Paractinoplanes toevensis]|uniref:Oxidoreductase n=1 Tax=Paractinoplanes toevensis TaxID=571911 RepID=A0A919TFJ4_9ACTN|nr:ferric reductase-like transmembrane domain-containing protein [Actinoplanes toevensis]GIM94212.1 oxidoreductase [Actinoplanes toevensis]
MFQTSRDQGYSSGEEDAQFFADLRAAPDDDDTWGNSASTSSSSRYDDSPSPRYDDSADPRYSTGTRLSDPRMPAERTPVDPWADDDREDRRPPQTWDSYIADSDVDDPYRRSDILVESHTDPTGWKASGPAQPPIPDDRPPAEAVSGNRLLTILLFFSGLATSVSLWLFDTQAGAINDTATAMLAAGRITGLIGGYLLFIQLLMMSRVSWLEEWVGARDLLRWHRWLGTSLVMFVLAHIVFIVYGYALTADTGVVDQGWSIITTFPDMLKAVSATVILVVISLISIRGARARLPYELWHLIHLTGYLVLLLGYGHQVATGADLSGKFASVFWPGLTALVISALVWGRLIEPLWLNVRHRFEVAEVVAEGANTFSIYIDGKKLEKLPAQAGQFMRWRFLTRNGWWQSHPFSLSAAPNREWLRLTVTAVGGHTSRLGMMQPGTPVWAEGPFGTFTAQRRTRRRALLIAGGSGIAPIRALLEDMPPDTIVIYRASRPDELVFRGELEELAERRDAWVRYIVGSRNDPGPRRLFSPDGLLGLVPDVSRRDVYLCGPPGLVEAAVATLRELDVPDSQLHLDPFEF